MKLEIHFIFMGLILNAMMSKASAVNYKVYRVQTANQEHSDKLRLLADQFKLDIWVTLREYSDIMVLPGEQYNFENALKLNNITYRVMIDNDQNLLNTSSARRVHFDWTKYHTIDEINAWLEQIAQDFPKVVQPFTIGLSYEGRPIKGIKISYKYGNEAIFIESNIYANNWITSAFATYLIDQLLHSRAAGIRDIAENVDWYFIPVINPDGFVYSQQQSRKWIKSRKPSSYPPVCLGTNLNRNFDCHWMEYDSSNYLCDNNFAGPYAESDPEIQLLVKYIKSLRNNYIQFYIALHSDVQNRNVLSPWGYSDSQPRNYFQMQIGAAGFANGAKKRNGTIYGFGTWAAKNSKISGDSMDWAYDIKKIPISYTIVLPDDKNPPLDQRLIIPVCKETLDGFYDMIKAAREAGILEKFQK